MLILLLLSNVQSVKAFAGNGIHDMNCLKFGKYCVLPFRYTKTGTITAILACYKLTPYTQTLANAKKDVSQGWVTRVEANMAGKEFLGGYYFNDYPDKITVAEFEYVITKKLRRAMIDVILANSEIQDINYFQLFIIFIFFVSFGFYLNNKRKQIRNEKMDIKNK